MDGLKNGRILMHVRVDFTDRKHTTCLSNITGRRQPQPADQASTHVRKNVTVQVGHDHDTIGKWFGVLCYLLFDSKTMQ